MDPQVAFADLRLQELAIAIYEAPLSGVREAPGYPDLDDPLDIAVLLIDADTEIEMQGPGGFFYNSTGGHVDATIAALERIGATRSAETLASAVSAGTELVSLFNAHFAVDDAFDRLLWWLSTRLDRLDRRVAALGHEWRTSAGLVQDRCPGCGSDGVACVHDEVVGTELRWSSWFRCGLCDQLSEARAAGRLPERYRAAALARGGTWGARPDAGASPGRVATAVARGLGLPLDDARARTDSADGLVVTGTRAEAEHAAALLRVQGVGCVVVRLTAKSQNG